MEEDLDVILAEADLEHYLIFNPLTYENSSGNASENTIDANSSSNIDNIEKIIRIPHIIYNYL